LRAINSSNGQAEAFDLLWQDGRDLRGLPLSERKVLLRKLLPRQPRALVYVQHVTRGTDLFRMVCERDLEGIVAKLAAGSYDPADIRWVKIKNPSYSQAAGRREFFDRQRR
jgi:bifunctional non-homologous end joining protein LigD